MFCLLSTAKITTWNKASGHGRLFSSYADESGEIRVVAFNAMCVKFSAYFLEDAILQIQCFECKPIAPAYRQTNATHEVILSGWSIVQAVDDSELDVPESVISYDTLASSASKPARSLTNVCAIVSQIAKTVSFRRPTSAGSVSRRLVRLIDDSNQPLISQSGTPPVKSQRTTFPRGTEHHSKHKKIFLVRTAGRTTLRNQRLF